MSHVYFQGTKQQWKNINKGKEYNGDNEFLKNTLYIHCKDGDLIITPPEDF